jgi:hypothetical protein
MQLPSSAPYCRHCVHYYVSWDPRFPRGCRVFGVKTRDLPSHVVYRSTGAHCPAFERNPKLKSGGGEPPRG